LSRLSRTEDEINATETSGEVPSQRNPVDSERTSHVNARVIKLHAETVQRIIKEGPGKEMQKVIKFFKNMIAHLTELNKFDGNQNRMVWCKEMQADLQEASKPFQEEEEALGEDANSDSGRKEEMARQAVQTNIWALGMIKSELDFLCGQSFRVIRGTTRMEDMKQVLKTYQESLTCVAGDAPCSPNGKVSGVRPDCECKCKAGFKHGDEERCEVPVTAEFRLRAPPTVVMSASATKHTAANSNGTSVNGTRVNRTASLSHGKVAKAIVPKPR